MATSPVPQSGLQFVAVLFISTLCFQIMANQIFRVDFEVFGRVQGVFFRKYTQRKAQELMIRGWCRNTDHNTVQGVLEGDQTKINTMKTWLQKEGSPQSRVDKVVFSKEILIQEYSVQKFEIRS